MPQKLKYVFMGTPDFAATCLETLCEKLYAPVAVVTQPSRGVGRGQVLKPTAVEYFATQQELMIIPTDDVNLPANVSLLESLHPDLILVAAFGQFLKDPILKLPKLFCLNVHGSVLPKYRGAAPIQRAIWNGEMTTGISVQRMEKKMDTGDVLLSRELAIEPEETSGELSVRLAKLGGECLFDAVRQIETGTATFMPQIESDATYAPKITKEEAILDWTQPAERLHNQIRALQPWPVAETLLEKTRLKIFGASVVDADRRQKAGDIVTDSKTFLTVTCGNGRALSLTEIQLENKKRLNIKDFLVGFRGTFPHKKLGLRS